jgi:hypothetical protein
MTSTDDDLDHPIPGHPSLSAAQFGVVPGHPVLSRDGGEE